MRRIHGGLALTCASALLLSACGDGDAVVDPTETPTATETVTDDPVGSETEDDALAAYCAVAEEMFAADGIPTADQITRYADLAPAEIRAEADIAAAALVPVGGDVVAFIATYAQDEEIVTVDLEPGNYAFVCFLPDAEFTPHAFQGMAMDVTVA